MSRHVQSCGRQILALIVRSDTHTMTRDGNRDENDGTCSVVSLHEQGQEWRADMNPKLIRDLELQRQRAVALLLLPGRVQNALLRHGIRTVGQLNARLRRICSLKSVSWEPPPRQSLSGLWPIQSSLTCVQGVPGRADTAEVRIRRSGRLPPQSKPRRTLRCTLNQRGVFSRFFLPIAARTGQG